MLFCIIGGSFAAAFHLAAAVVGIVGHFKNKQ